MKPIDIVILAVIAGIIVLAALYVIKAKKNGRKCVGCPHSGSCCGSCNVK